jgi:hypothetical protein
LVEEEIESGSIAKEAVGLETHAAIGADDDLYTLAVLDKGFRINKENPGLSFIVTDFTAGKQVHVYMPSFYCPQKVYYLGLHESEIPQ